MEVLLLGTGSADGWPNPFCTCASCRGQRGDVRGPTAALVDDVVLLDLGSEAPRSALRAGRDLARVRHVLVTHAHPDHLEPLALLVRRWAGRTEPLDLVGPPSVIAACEPWCGPGDPVRPWPVRPGDRLVLGAGSGDPDGRYLVRVLAAAHDGDAVLYELSSLSAREGARLLYATDTGPIPAATLAALRGRPCDLVLMEETFGDDTGHGTDHLDLATFPRVLADLRAVGAVVAGTRVVAVHLSHHNPPAAELARRLGAWGVEVHADGTSLVIGTAAESRTDGGGPHRTLVLGGARSGKSVEAERRLADRAEVVYVATSGQRPDDPEWAQRVAAHRARRPSSWATAETLDLEALLRAAGPALLVDCLSLWLAGVMDQAGCWTQDPGALARVRKRVGALVDAWRSTGRHVVAVSNEVGSGVVPATESGRSYRDELGRLNALLAAHSEDVLLMVAGRPVPLTVPSGPQGAGPQ